MLSAMDVIICNIKIFSRVCVIFCRTLCRTFVSTTSACMSADFSVGATDSEETGTYIGWQ